MLIDAGWVSPHPRHGMPLHSLVPLAHPPPPGHYADAGEVAVLMSSSLDVHMVRISLLGSLLCH